MLRLVVNQCVANQDLILAKRKRPHPLHTSDKYFLLNSGGDEITSPGWQSVRRRFLELAIKEGIWAREDWFRLHDMKPRGTTYTTGTTGDEPDATGLSNRQVLKVYDNSIPELIRIHPPNITRRNDFMMQPE